jgi:hypothetical protein
LSGLYERMRDACEVLLDVLVDETDTDGDEDDCGWGENAGAGVSGGGCDITRRLARDSIFVSGFSILITCPC